MKVQSTAVWYGSVVLCHSPVILFWGNYTELFRDVSFQISINYLAKWFQRRFYFKLANHKQELPMAAILVVWSAQNMAILYRFFL